MNPDQNSEKPEPFNWKVACLMIALPMFLVPTIRKVSDWWNLPPKCLDLREVQSVGGCDATGTCGVTFSDGTNGEVSYPSKGKAICLKWE